VQRINKSGVFQIAKNPYFGDQAKFTRFLVERYHASHIWVDKDVLIEAEQIHLVIGLPINLDRDIQSVLGMTKKFTDDDIHKELGEGEKMSVHSRGIVI